MRIQRVTIVACTDIYSVTSCALLMDILLMKVVSCLLSTHLAWGSVGMDDRIRGEACGPMQSFYSVLCRAEVVLKDSTKIA